VLTMTDTHDPSIPIKKVFTIVNLEEYIFI
jgi:hypothetical protein